MLGDNELKLRLSTRPAPNVTKEYMEARIEDITYVYMYDVSRKDDTTTICTLYLDNGYSVRGESSCVNFENFDREIGARLAYDNAISKLWPLFGFLLAESQFQKVQEQ